MRTAAVVSQTGPALAALLLGSAALLFVAQRTQQNGGLHARQNGSRPRRRVVILGAGFGGLSAAKPLAREADVDLTVIDVHNHHLFQPLLYQVATAALSESDIASPIRSVVPTTDRVRVLMGMVSGIDVAARRVLWDGGAVPYDDLVIATGSTPSYFGHDDWEKTAPGLKTLDDALSLRQRILTAFERASSAASAEERRRLLTFVLVGAGPTGVEMAGSIAELARDLLTHDYGAPHERARILLVEAGPRVLAEFAPDSSSNAAQALQELGVEIRTGAPVTGVEPDCIRLGSETIAAATIIWTAGNVATPVAQWLGLQAEKGGRVKVGPDLSIAGHPEIRVIGDAALATDRHGRALPALAPVAKQQGAYVAHAIVQSLRGQSEPSPFRYKDYGQLATVGRGKAVAEFGRVHLAGTVAWITWAIAHIFFLIGFRNRVIVSTEWAFAYFTRERGARLITGRNDVASPRQHVSDRERAG